MKTAKDKTNSRAEKAVIIYDGSCPVCSGTIAWIRDNEQKDSFEMLPCRSEEMKQRYPFMEESACMKAMQLVLPDGGVLSGEEALPEILKRLKRYGPAASLFKLPGSKTAARVFYRWFADRRYHIANRWFRKNKK